MKKRHDDPLGEFDSDDEDEDGDDYWYPLYVTNISIFKFFILS